MNASEEFMISFWLRSAVGTMTRLLGGCPLYRGSIPGMSKTLFGSGAQSAPNITGAWGFFLVGKAARRETDYSLPPNSEVKNVYRYASTPTHVSRLFT
jgi:hypothetical protein